MGPVRAGERRGGTAIWGGRRQGRGTDLQGWRWPPCVTALHTVTLIASQGAQPTPIPAPSHPAPRRRADVCCPQTAHQALFQALCTHSPRQPEETQDMIIPILQGGKMFCSFLFLCSLSLNLGDTAETWELRSKPGSSKSRSKFITTLAGCSLLSYGEHPLVGTAGIPQTQGEHSRQQLGTSDTQVRESQGHSNSACGRSTSLGARAWSSLCAFLPERLLVPRR